MRVIQSGEEFAIPCAQCPECGGDLCGEVSEWYQDTHEPTEGGLLVWCEHAGPESGDTDHRHCGSDWLPVQAVCQGWAARHVRVVEVEVPHSTSSSSK
jgi:hypothetical protein